MIDLLDYDPETGHFTWKHRRLTGTKADHFNARYAGKRAGTVMQDGYRTIRVGDKTYLEHRLAYLFMTGEVPDEVDHENHDRADNRWCNLRSSTRSTNQQNTRGWGKYAKGVTRINRKRPFRAAIRIGGKLQHLGSFFTEEEAAASYIAAAVQHFGDRATAKHVRYTPLLT